MDRVPDLVLAIAGYAAVFVITAITIALTACSSPARLAAFALTVALAIPVHASVMTNTEGQNVAAGALMFVWLHVLSAFDLFFCSKVSYDQHVGWLRGQNRTRQVLKDTSAKRIIWGFKQSINYRRVNTVHKIRSIPPLNTLNPGCIPSRKTFLLNRLLTFILASSILHLFLHARPIPIEKGQLRIMLNEYTISLSSLPARIYLVASHVLATFLDHKAIYAALSFISVLLGIDSPADWPPNQGSISEAWTVRRYWGYTWHQTFRAPLTAITDFIVFSVLRLRPRIRITRYTRFFITFFISGLLHIPYGYSVGATPRDKTISAALLFFSIQPIAFGLEEVVQWFCARYGILADAGDRPTRMLIGYIWVGTWCVLTWPIWIFPRMRGALGEGDGGGGQIWFLHLTMPTVKP